MDREPTTASCSYNEFQLAYYYHLSFASGIRRYQHVLDHGSYTKQKITNSDSKQVYSEASSTQTHCALACAQQESLPVNIYVC
ncbi:Hypothetical predicted protein [Podarcis lilfordi]|uniref:Uncharacterized protein n=1 Tax=Podarcis lilfordi TaxID=74358 RepID=A0AA35PGV0_9SAUR|nr:Hypothetical predicted protein [Podarcis lilfordi]